MGLLKKLFGKSDDGVGKTKHMDASDWAAIMQELTAFRNLPPDTIAEMCAQMEVIPVKEGTVLIRQGDEGDYYYIIAAGMAKVTRGAVMLAKLEAGSRVGEEALITNAKRNATVTMITDGTVMRLSKTHFNAFLKEPQLVWLSQWEAQAKVDKGARWLDVRPAEDFRRGALSGAISIPMIDLRRRLRELNGATFYVCYCETGRESAAAAFLLKQYGGQTAVLRGGLRRYEGPKG